jgi:hypothetical protein
MSKHSTSIVPTVPESKLLAPPVAGGRRIGSTRSGGTAAPTMEDPMASVMREIAIDAAPDDVWDALRDFGAVHERLAPGFVVATELDADETRVVTFFSGAVARERLVGVDEATRRLVYSVVEGPLGSIHHNAFGPGRRGRRRAHPLRLDHRRVAGHGRGPHRRAHGPRPRGHQADPRGLIPGCAPEYTE